MSHANDVYATITNQIINDLEKGDLTWRKPWNSEHLASSVVRPLRFNDIPYSGINTIVLWAAAAAKGYWSPYWMTFKQATSMKATVRKGEKASQVVYADSFTKAEETAEGTTEQKEVHFLKLYHVFNASQIDGLPEAFYKTPEQPAVTQTERIPAWERFFAETKADIFTGKKAAYYEMSDRIEMPPYESFTEAQGYYATLAHEATHWTKHPSRLNRDFNRQKWGDEGYAKEELVAELGSCFLAADLGFVPKNLEQHAAYIQSWLKVLKDDKRFVFQAASHAQKAIEYLTHSPSYTPSISV